MLILCVWLELINKVKVTSQGEGHIKVKEKHLHPYQFYVAHTVSKWVFCIRIFLIYTYLQTLFLFVENNMNILHMFEDISILQYINNYK